MRVLNYYGKPRKWKARPGNRGVGEVTSRYSDEADKEEKRLKGVYRHRNHCPHPDIRNSAANVIYLVALRRTLRRSATEGIETYILYGTTARVPKVVPRALHCTSF